MAISVVIPSAGMTSGNRALLAGALKASSGADETIVVITDGCMSSVGSRAIKAAHANVVNVEGEFNFSRAVNAGAAKARGDWLMILNDDIFLARHTPVDWVRTLARKRGDIKGVLLLDSNEERIQHAGVWFGGPGGLPCHIGWREPAAIRYRDGPVLAVTGAAIMVRRTVFHNLGGFDEAFPIHFGDVDFCLRARSKQLRVNVWNSIALVHREASTKTPYDLLPSFRLLKERHDELLAEEGIFLSPEVVAIYFSAVHQ